MRHEIHSEQEVKNALKGGRAWKASDDEEVWEGDENCKHVLRSASGGGIECIKCGGWCCY